MTNKYSHLPHSRFPRLKIGVDNPIVFGNCADTEGGFLHGLDGSELTNELIDSAGNVVHSEVQNLTNNVENVVYHLSYTDTESLPEGIYKVRMRYLKDGIKQELMCCKYILVDC